MQAKITHADGFKCAPDGHTVITYPLGAEVEGRVALWAIDAGAAQAYDPRDTIGKVPDLETKAPPKKRGRPRGKAKT